MTDGARALRHDLSMLDVRLKAPESLLFRSDVLVVGKFRCPATHPLFRDTGPCSYHTFVFPRTVTRIHLAGGRSVVGTPGAVMLYNQHQVYTRTAVSEIDASDWYTVADDVLMEMTGARSPERPFAEASRPSDGRSFLAQRMIFDALDRGAEVDPMHVEEAILGVLQRIVAPPRETTLRARDVDAVEHARDLISRDPSRNTPLRGLAAACDLSPFRLCRAFRAHTGETMTRWRHSLRLRLALDRLRDGADDLTALALDLGYSSHSHFTAVFRRHFGITPSQFRAG